jgi:hypothetical protein
MKAANKKNFELVVAGPDGAKIQAEVKAAEPRGVARAQGEKPE